MTSPEQNHPAPFLIGNLQAVRELLPGESGPELLPHVEAVNGLRRVGQAKALPPRWLVSRWLFLCLLCLGPWSALAQTNLPILTTAQQVKQLTPAQARSPYPVRVRGVVTFVSIELGQLFLQDDTGGVFVEIQGDYGFVLRSGQLLELEGNSAPGGFAPDIVPQRMRLLGEAPLPAPRPVTFEQMAAGQQDCNWVEFKAIVRSVRREPLPRAGLNVVGGGGRVIVAISQPDLDGCERFVDAEVSIRGVCIAQFNRNRQFIQVALQAQSMADITVLKPAPADPYAAPLRESSRLLSYAPEENDGHRVRVRGVVTWCQPGRRLFLTEGTQGLYIQTEQTSPVQPGDIVEALGFPAAGQYVAPILQDAVFRKVGQGPAPQPLPIAAADGRRDTNHAALVQLEGVVLNHVERLRDQTLQLRSGAVVLDALLDEPPGRQHRLAAIPDGSRVRVTGLCLVPADLEVLSAYSQFFSLMLRSPDDIIVLERPSWWTVRHSLWVLGVTLAAVCASLAWVGVLRHRVQVQTRIIRAQTQRETALEERSRIARDLHDELGSRLTHITLLSERSSNEAPAQQPANLHKIAATARQLTQSLDEIVWAVNPEHDTLEGLVEYLSQCADDFLEDTPIRCRLTRDALLPQVTVPADLRHGLFLAFKEALNNAVKHAGASEIEINFALQPPGLRITIADNGTGFDPASARSSRCGLKNLRRRLADLGGQFELVSQPGQGTRVTMAVPL